MKKLSFIVMTCLMVLGLTQCKKNDPSNNNNADSGDRVSITLTLENGGQRVHPEEDNGLANIVYDNGDVVYVGSDGKYMGYLTYNGSVFTGSINAAAIEGEPLQFVFMGGQDFHGSLTENSSADYTFNIGNQGSTLAVISCAASNESFSTTNLSYTAYLRNKCALVKFDLGAVSTDAAITLSGLKNTATIGFDGTVTNGSTTGDIVAYGTGSTRYAVVLSDQAAVTNGTLSAEGYTGTFSIPTAAYTNAFLTDASMTMQASGNPAPTTASIDAYTGGAFSWGAKATMNYSTMEVTFDAPDEISILSANNTNTKFTTSAGGASATFSGTATDDSKFYAVYPYTAGLTLSGDVISGVVIPSDQWNAKWGDYNYPESSWDPKAPIAYATTEGSSLQFHNLCAILKIRPYWGGDGWITISADQDLAGTFSLDTSTGTLTATAGSKSVTIGSSSDYMKHVMAFGDYLYIAIAPGSYTNFKVRTDEDYGGGAEKTKASVTFEAGKIYDLGDVQPY